MYGGSFEGAEKKIYQNSTSIMVTQRSRSQTSQGRTQDSRRINQRDGCCDNMASEKYYKFYGRKPETTKVLARVVLQVLESTSHRAPAPTREVAVILDSSLTAEDAMALDERRDEIFDSPAVASAEEGACWELMVTLKPCETKHTFTVTLRCIVFTSISRSCKVPREYVENLSLVANLMTRRLEIRFAFLFYGFKYICSK